MNSDLGRPIDFALFKLQQAADKRGKELESHADYFMLCKFLTDLDFDDVIVWRTKEWCYNVLRQLTEYVFRGECVSATSWLLQTFNEFDEMREWYQNEQTRLA